MKLGAYELLRPLDKGGMASVWLAQAKQSKLIYAIKLILPHQATNGREHFISEIKILSELRHPNIIVLHDYGLVSEEEANQPELGLPAGSPFCVMEYHPGGTYANQDPLAWEELKDVLKQILEGLSTVHAAGIIHCDLKPNNILKSKRGPIITDFGIAQRLDRANIQKTRQTESQNFSGTPSYISPEQINSQISQYGPWTDLYSIGCLAYKLSTGSTPFNSSSILHTVLAHLETLPPPLQPIHPLPIGFESWAKWCLEKKTLNRPSFAIHALDKLLSLDTSFSNFNQTVISNKASFSNSKNNQLWMQINQFLNKEDSQSRGIILLEDKDGWRLRKVCQNLLEKAHQHGLAMPLKIHYHPQIDENNGIAGLLQREWCAYDMNHEQLCEYLISSTADKDTYGAIDEEDIASLASFISIPDKTADFTSMRARFTALERWINKRTWECPRILWIENIQWGGEILSWVTKLIHQQKQKLFIILSYQHEQESIANKFIQSSERNWFHPRRISLKEVADLADLEPMSMNDVIDKHYQYVDIAKALHNSEKALEIAKVAAVIGQQFAQSLYEKICQRLGILEDQDLLLILLKSGILKSESQGRLSFVDASQRETLLNQIDSLHKVRHYHKIIAEERLKEPHVSPILLIRHWIAANEINQALMMIPLQVERIKRVEDYVMLKNLLGLWIKCLRQSAHKLHDQEWLAVKVYWSEYCGLIDLQNNAARHALQAIERLKDHHPKSSSLLLEASVRRAEALKWSLQSSDEVLDLINQAVDIAEELTDPVKQAYTLERQGVFFHTYGYLEAAEDSFQKALKLIDCSVVPRRLQSIIHLGISRLLIERDRLELARSHCRFALDLLSQKFHNTLRASIFLTLGDIYRQLKESQRAIKYYHKAVQIFKKFGAAELWATHLNLALAYTDQENWGLAESEFTHALALVTKSKSLSFIKLINSCSLYSAAHRNDWLSFDHKLSQLLSLSDHRYAQFDSAILLERLALYLGEEGHHQRAKGTWQLTHAHFLALGLHERASLAKNFIKKSRQS